MNDKTGCKVKYESFNTKRQFLAVGMIVIAFVSIYLLSKQLFQSIHWLIIIFWSLVPPIWFFFEYYWMDKGYISPPKNVSKSEFLESAKHYMAGASKVWAGVLAAVLFLYKHQ